MNKKMLGLVALATLSTTLAACQSSSSETSSSASSMASSQTVKLSATKASILVEGYEFGPAVPKVVLSLDAPVTKVDKGKVKVTTAGVKRKVLAAYLSDEKGGEVKDGASQYVTLDLEVTYHAEDPMQNASPFTFSLESMRNNWVTSYEVSVSDLNLESEMGKTRLDYKTDAVGNMIKTASDQFANRGTTSGDYTNPLTGATENITLQYAAYEPVKLADGEKNPLLIWLHGGGEGGTDIEIALLGNEVTGLASGGVQSHFTSTGQGQQTGAYVLAVQTPTMWMADENGHFNPAAKTSRYTEALMKTIQDYVAAHPDIDADRVYLSGCSNGGFMTLELGVKYPDYFAALVPSATPYPYYNSYQKTEDYSYIKSETADSEPLSFDETKLAALADQPIWFIHSQTDTTIFATDYALPVYKALVDSGAGNKWFSYYESVEGEDVKEVTYNGHWVWTYYFNDKVSGVQNVEAVKSAGDLSGFIASNATNGGSGKATVGDVSYNNLFEWLNDQVNTPAS